MSGMDDRYAVLEVLIHMLIIDTNKGLLKGVNGPRFIAL